MTEPNDRELEQYLKGESALSRKYREASRETAPPELDDAIVARARAAVKRKPAGLSRWAAGFALAASLILGVNLGWNVYKSQPQPGEAPAYRGLEADRGRVQPAPAVPPSTQASVPATSNDSVAAAKRLERKSNQAAAEAKAPEPFPASPSALSPPPSGMADSRVDADELRQEEAARREQYEQLAKRKSEALQEAERDASAAKSAQGAAAGAAAPAPAQAENQPKVALTEPQKIDRLIAYVGGLQGAVFIRNGREYPPDEAVKHLQLKRSKAGDKVKTADDFIKYCASYSTVSGEAYLIRFPDGRTRTAEDVLREELARLN